MELRIIIPFNEYLVHAVHFAKFFMHIISFNVHNQLIS